MYVDLRPSVTLPLETVSENCFISKQCLDNTTQLKFLGSLFYHHTNGFEIHF